MDQVYVRLYSYKYFRHYGGREITTTPHICSALFIKEQADHTMLVQLLEDCAGYKKGSMLAIIKKDFNIQINN